MNSDLPLYYVAREKQSNIASNTIIRLLLKGLHAHIIPLSLRYSALVFQEFKFTKGCGLFWYALTSALDFFYFERSFEMEHVSLFRTQYG